MIATGVSRPPSDEPEPRVAPERETERENEAEATGRDAAAAVLEGSDGELQTETAAQSGEAVAPAEPVCEQPPADAPGSEQPALPEPPPEDLDPEDPDEDDDGVLDADEKVAYDEAVAAQAARGSGFGTCSLLSVGAAGVAVCRAGQGLVSVREERLPLVSVRRGLSCQ